MSRKKLYLASAGALTVCLALFASPTTAKADTCGVAGNLVANCGFETGNFTDWTTVPASAGSDFDVTTAPHSGSWAAAFGAVSGQNDYIYQNLATTPGDAYSVSFWLSNSGATGEFVANWGNSNLLTYLGDDAASPYTEYTYSVTANSDLTQLEFGGNTPPGWYYLDDVSVVDNGSATPVVPEPPSFLLLGTGLLGLAALLMRKRLSAALSPSSNPQLQLL